MSKPKYVARFDGFEIALTADDALAINRGTMDDLHAVAKINHYRIARTVGASPARAELERQGLWSNHFVYNIEAFIRALLVLAAEQICENNQLTNIPR